MTSVEAAANGLITTVKLNDIDPRAWLADVLTWMANPPQNHLLWTWKPA